MTNITINSLPVASTIDGSADILPIYTASALATQGISRNTFLGITSGPVGLTDSQTLTNKIIGNTNTLTIKDTNFTLQDDGDTTKQAKFQLSGLTTATTRTYTLPDVTDSIVTLTATQTLTNKTLTSPTIATPTITNATISADTLTGFSVSTTGSVYGISVVSSAIQSNTAFADGIILPKALTAGTGSTWAWSSWTPTFTTLTVGNGTHASSYIQIGKTVVARLQFTLGSTSAMTTGTVTFTLPVTAVALAANCYLGTARINTSTSSPAIIYMASTTTGGLKSQLASGTYVAEDNFSATVPGTFGTGSVIAGTFVFEAA